MSIRCEELNIPAIIGFGEDNFSKINNSDKININCKLRKLISKTYNINYV